MANSSLESIRIKVRRLTQSPSTAILSDADLDQYINTFIQYDFPEHLRTFKLRQSFTFYCNPFQDTYVTDTTLPVTNPLYNFQNKYTTVHPPVYIAGYQSMYSQTPEEFYGIYPTINSISQIGSGNGAQTLFTGFININQSSFPPSGQQVATLLQNNVRFTSISVDNEGLTLTDVPLRDATTGQNSQFGRLYNPFTGIPVAPIFYPTDFDPNNWVNYVTGEFRVTFSSAPGVGQLVFSQTVPTICAIPQCILWFQNKFTLRPVPNQPYAINFEVYVRPIELLESNQSPELEEWWQYISYGAAIKIFQDRMDLDSVSLLMPEFRVQQNLVNRRTIVQNTNERTATIYTQTLSNGMGYSGFGGWGNSGGGF